MYSVFEFFMFWVVFVSLSHGLVMLRALICFISFSVYPFFLMFHARADFHALFIEVLLCYVFLVLLPFHCLFMFYVVSFSSCSCLLGFWYRRYNDYRMDKEHRMFLLILISCEPFSDSFEASPRREEKK